MSNIGGPISPTEQITFEIDRLLRISEADCGTTRDFYNNNNLTSNNNNNKTEEENNNNNSNNLNDFFFEKTESIASSISTSSSSSSTSSAVTTASSNNNANYPMLPPMMNLSPSLLQTSNQVSVGISGTPAATAIVVSGKHHNNKAQQNQNQSIIINNNKTGAEYFASLIQSANNADNNNNNQNASLSWSHVAYICDCLADEIFTNQNKTLKREVIELVQKEFDQAFEATNKNIKRRHIALMLVAHLFAAPNHILPEKIFVGAIYRALNISNEKSSSSASSLSCPPLHVLLSIARALEVASCHFDKENSLGKQHLPFFLGKLCNGLILTSPNQTQHQELCDAIKTQSAVLHGFRASNNKKLQQHNCL